MTPLCSRARPTESAPGEVPTGIDGVLGRVGGSCSPRRESNHPHCHPSDRWRAPRGWGRIHVEDNVSHAAPAESSPRPSPPPTVRLPPPRRFAPRAGALPGDPASVPGAPKTRKHSRNSRNASVVCRCNTFLPETLRQPQDLRLPLFTLKPIPIIPEIPSALGCGCAGENATLLPAPPASSGPSAPAFYSETDSHNSRNTSALRPRSPVKRGNPSRNASASSGPSAPAVYSETDSHNSRNTSASGAPAPVKRGSPSRNPPAGSGLRLRRLL